MTKAYVSELIASMYLPVRETGTERLLDLCRAPDGHDYVIGTMDGYRKSGIGIVHAAGCRACNVRCRE